MEDLPQEPTADLLPPTRCPKEAMAARGSQAQWLLVSPPKLTDYLPPHDVVDEDLKCSVCLNWPDDPIVLGCAGGHMFCRSCVRSASCPLDRQPFATTLPPQRPIVAMLERLRVRCPHSEEGCDWQGVRGSFRDHWARCSFAELECVVCGLRVLRSDSESAEHRHTEQAQAPAPPPAPVPAQALEEVVANSALAERRQRQIARMIEVYEQAERLNACFVVDCTGSMGPHLRAVKNQIHGIVHEMQRRLPSMRLNLAFVGYRDHCDSVRFEVLPFTPSVDDFRLFVAALVPRGGGGDGPEDVHGAVQQACGLNWAADGAATRVLIHIADYPAHGRQFNDCPADSFPDGDPHGLDLFKLMRDLQAKSVQYIFGHITGYTQKMVRVLNETLDGYVSEKDMRDTALVTDAVTASLQTATASTVSTLTSRLGDREPEPEVTLDPAMPEWAGVAGVRVTLQSCHLVRDVSDLYPEADPAATCSTSERTAIVKLAPLPFSQGESRLAYHALSDGEPSVAKFLKRRASEADADDADASAGDGAPPSRDAERAVQLALSEVCAVAAFLAQLYSASAPAGQAVAFLTASAAEASTDMAPFGLEGALPADEFRRYSNNIGWWEPDAPEALMKFARWTHEVTRGHMMVVDLQGVPTADGWLLTDPCVLCQDVTRFGAGNLGPHAIERCLTALERRLDGPALPPQDPEPVAPAAAPFVATARSMLPPGFVASLPPAPQQPVAPGGWQLSGGSSSSGPAAAAGDGANSAGPAAPAGAAGARRRTAAGRPPPAPATLDLDGMLGQLLGAQGLPPSRGVQLPEADVKTLLAKSREVLLTQPTLLELDAPVKVLGDIHGQFHDLLRHFEVGGLPPDSNYLLLGDYVDRGKLSVETMCLLLAYKVKYPENMFLLRGNHECASITRIYGFYDECKRKYNVKLWKQFCDVFNCLPPAALIEDRILCMHGGLSPELHRFEDIRSLARPCDVPDTGLLCDMLWSDPDRDIAGWVENDRGVSYTFGPDVVVSFNQRHNLDLIVRAHQVVEDGYEFFAGRQLVTLFSAPYYCGEFDNAGAMLQVSDDLFCSFRTLGKYDGGSGKKGSSGGGSSLSSGASTLLSRLARA